MFCSIARVAAFSVFSRLALICFSPSSGPNVFKNTELVTFWWTFLVSDLSFCNTLRRFCVFLRIRLNIRQAELTDCTALFLVFERFRHTLRHFYNKTTKIDVGYAKNARNCKGTTLLVHWNSWKATQTFKY